MATDYAALLGSETASKLLEHKSETISRDALHLPGADFVERIFMDTDRSNPVLRNLQGLWDAGRLGGSGYVSILPVDQESSTPLAHLLVLILDILTR